MESSKIGGKFDEMSRQLIIAMSGDPGKRSEIAFKLAQFPKFHLIDAADIIDNEEYDSFPYSLQRKIEDAAMKAVSKISTTQLMLKLNVIINNLMLYRPSHFEDLARLATYEGARLLFIQCGKAQSQEEEEEIAEFDVYYRIRFGNHVPKLIIDTTEPFVVEEFVPTLLHSAADQELSSSSSSKSQQQIIQPSQRMITQEHAHEFIIMEDHHDQKLRNDTYCNQCTKLISPFSGSAGYRCIVCEHFNLHKSCAESTNIDYQVQSSYKCRLCKKFTESCNDCLLQTHIALGCLPTAFCRYEKLEPADADHIRHRHPLSFVIMPVWVKYKYLCFGCNEMGECVSYKCFSCNLDFHIDCILPEEDMKVFFLNISEPLTTDEVNKLRRNADGVLQYVYHVCGFMKEKRKPF